MDDPQKIKVLTDDEYSNLIFKIQDRARISKIDLPGAVAESMVDAVMEELGAIWPWVPDTDTCTAMLATPGNWEQCDMDPGHGDGHDNGGWAWSDSDVNAVPAQQPKA